MGFDGGAPSGARSHELNAIFLRRPSEFRFSLGTLILLCLSVGTAGGLYFHWRVRQPHFEVVSRNIDGFLVQNVWVRQFGSKEELVYLVAFPDGDRHGGGSSFSVGTHPRARGVDFHGDAIFVAGENRFDDHPGSRYWVYMSHMPGGDVRPVEVDPSHELLTRDQFATLEKMRLWNDALRPALVLESQHFDEWFYRNNGFWLPSPRFPADSHPTSTSQR